MTFQIMGPDVSFYQDNNETPQKINFHQMGLAGADFTIIRAGQNKWVDQDFFDNWKAAREAGLRRGAYWFFDSRYSPVRQAELFASLFKDDPPEMEVFLDLEENYNGPYSGYANWKIFINRFKQLCPNIVIGIYTSYGYISGKIPYSERLFFGSLPLWLAWYGVEFEEVIVPYPWKEMKFWQYAILTQGRYYGCESEEIDMNYFIGTADEFYNRYPQGEPPMTAPYYEVRPNVAGEYRSIRKYANPNINGMKIGQVNANSFGKCFIADAIVYSADVVVDGTLKAMAGDKWLHIYEANGATIDGWIAEKHLGRTYLTVTQMGDPTTPPPAGYPVRVLVEWSDGNVYASTTFEKL